MPPAARRRHRDTRISDRARHLPAGVSFAVGALFEPICVCLQAIAQAKLSAGEALLILGELVTHTLPLEDYEQAFELAAHGQDRAIKVAMVQHTL